ncbi:NlpC/P60 family protein [Deinococcus pimensis]|uniref:NlpC/P60 family protein n=1 Tax=Deinococcus pimensis TaxID=309888 RepID=UPI0004B08179
MYRVGLPVDRASLRPGDLVFYDTEGRGQVSHVGIYLGNEVFVPRQHLLGPRHRERPLREVLRGPLPRRTPRRRAQRRQVSVTSSRRGSRNARSVPAERSAMRYGTA